jgi:predicted enzyme related to lactoylglutathione lyase
MIVPMHMFAVTIDCSDPARLARFYQGLLGGSVTATDGTFMALAPDRGLRLYFQPVEQYRRPTWPDSGTPAQMHVDVAVDDLDEAERRAVTLGARKAARQPAAHRFRVFVDPEGHPFCLVAPVAAMLE